MGGGGSEHRYSITLLGVTQFKMFMFNLKTIFGTETVYISQGHQTTSGQRGSVVERSLYM